MTYYLSLPGTNGLRGILKGAQPKPFVLAPGIYQAEPYACLVAVPGPIHDDCYIGGGMDGMVSKMPVSKPELEFKPRARK